MARKINTSQWSAAPEIIVGRKCMHYTELFFWLTCIIFAASLFMFKLTSDVIGAGNRRLDAAQHELDVARAETEAVCNAALVVCKD